MDESTERRYEALRRRINREYRQAEKELREKLEEFFAKSAERDKEKRKLLADGKITKQEYQRWLRGQVFQGKRWQEKIDQAARQLTQVDETATAIVNGERLNVFANNMNYQNGEAKRIIGARFDLYDSATVARLLDEQPNLLPPRKVKRSEDIPWYHKLISNCVTQGILQGESVPQIARRIGEQTGERGRKAMLRNARTAVTSAQNAGRMEAMHQQEQMGIRVQKKWIAAIDNRTRDAHRDPALAEQVIDIDQPFKTKLGEILFPGDPAAHPANVYNCRCTLGYVYPDYQPVAGGEEKKLNNGTGNGIIDEAEGALRNNELPMSRAEKLEVIRRGVAQEKPVFSYDTPTNDFPSRAQRAKPDHEHPDYLDVIAHGDEKWIDFFGKKIDAYLLANIIRNRKDWNGQGIRLLSCETGMTETTGDCVAQILANELGVNVIAPEWLVYCEYDGTLYTRKEGNKFILELKDFYPRGRSKRDGNDQQR